MYTLYRGFTGENWNMLLLDLMVQPPYCNPANDATGNCGDPIFSPLYWIAFIIASELVVEQLLTAIVLESFWKELPSPAFLDWEDAQGRKIYNHTHQCAQRPVPRMRTCSHGSHRLRFSFFFACPRPLLRPSQRV